MSNQFDEGALIINSITMACAIDLAQEIIGKVAGVEVTDRMNGDKITTDIITTMVAGRMIRNIAIEQN